MQTSQFLHRKDGHVWYLNYNCHKTTTNIGQKYIRHKQILSIFGLSTQIKQHVNSTVRIFAGLSEKALIFTRLSPLEQMQQ